ncbi:hypothetical protein [Arthrobacter sp. ISL-65]|uniref:hypothetical protein n=1 Tax=Arthrobacter sp. ISL-65 TaxID=2819112 RepID=UPI001BE8B40F|nr:hypothetical protein [Arthrobacter sp. ISL-65]MBT2548046.1 hypothetical protein [Arthrobacter sp. ISL-65]
MPVTRNVAWDGRLESFKGRDTTQYVRTAAATAKACAACGGPLGSDEPLSLLVNITQSTAPDGTERLIFTDCVCHRRCSGPALTVEQTPWQPDELSPVAARLLLTHKSKPGQASVVPALAYTLVPVVSFRENDGELTSALVALLLSHGFQLAMSPEYADILEQAHETAPSCNFTVTPQGAILLSIDGQILYREQLDPDHTDDAQWLEAAARRRHILIISGDNLDITDTSLDLHSAAGQGTLVIGTVPVADTS